MGSVILAGLAEATRHYAEIYQLLDPDAELWTLNRGLMKGIVDGCDRFFEMHPIEMLSDPKYDEEYRDWLFDEYHAFRVYMIEAYDEVANSEKYPLSAVVNDIFSGLWRMEGNGRWKKSHPYLTSTFSYMLGLAIHEKFDHIYLPGFDMKTTTEYAYQKSGAEMLVGFALARGIRVILPPESAVMKAVLYGYEGAQMISRQRLETMQRSYQMQLNAATSEINKLMGQHEELMKEYGTNGVTQEQAEKSADRVNQKVFEAQRISGALSLIEKQIAECDLQEPDEILPDRLRMLEAT